MIVQRRIGPLVLGITLVAGVAAPRSAYAGQDDDHQIGNGRFNRNNVSINSPSISTGDQEVNNQNIGGVNTVNNAICKWHGRCHIWQKMINKVGRVK